MKLGMQFTSRWVRLWALLCLGCISLGVNADSVWHCSRSDMQLADASEQFTLALPDLYSVYLGQPVKVSGMPLSACFIADEKKLPIATLQSIGVSINTVKALARKSNIAENHLHIVKDESAMLACIAKHHPAIGYLPKAMHTEAIGPCF
jgi:hypothetical protein